MLTSELQLIQRETSHCYVAPNVFGKGNELNSPLGNVSMFPEESILHEVFLYSQENNEGKNVVMQGHMPTYLASLGGSLNYLWNFLYNSALQSLMQTDIELVLFLQKVLQCISLVIGFVQTF